MNLVRDYSMDLERFLSSNWVNPKLDRRLDQRNCRIHDEFATYHGNGLGASRVNTGQSRFLAFGEHGQTISHRFGSS